MSGVWVADASPLIFLGRAGCLPLLPLLAERLLIPGPVAAEVRSSPACDWVRAEGAGFVVAAAEIDSRVAALDLGSGESAVLSMGLGFSPASSCTVLLDDLAARRAAGRLGLRVRGTLGILVAAKRRGLIPLVRPRVDLLIAEGFRASPALLERSLREAGETP